MKIVAINGSPRPNGNLTQLLEVVRKEVEAAGVEFEVVQPGAKVKACMACYHCLSTGSLRCIQDDDGVNEIIAGNQHTTDDVFERLDALEKILVENKGAQQ